MYIGPDQPTDGTVYWLDTSESGDSGDGGDETITHSVTAALTNVTIDNTAESVNEGDSFAAALTPDDGYALSSVSVTMGGVDITNTAYSNGNIYIASVTGDVVITAIAAEAVEGATTYSITNNLVNVTSDNSSVSVNENSTYTATLTAVDGYRLGNVTVTMGGVDVTADVYADGVISIPAVTGDVIITAVATEIIVVDEFTADWIVKGYTNKTIPTVTASDIEAAVNEFPETLNIIGIVLEDYWNSGKDCRFVYVYTSVYLDDGVSTSEIKIDGVRYGILTIQGSAVRSTYNSIIDGGNTPTVFKLQMGNSAVRFAGGDYYCYAGTVDETVIKGLFGV